MFHTALVLRSYVYKLKTNYLSEEKWLMKQLFHFWTSVNSIDLAADV